MSYGIGTVSANALQSLVTLASLLLSILAAYPPFANAASSGPQGAASILVGSQTIGDDADPLPEFGVDLFVRGGLWPAGISVYGSRSLDSHPCATECGDVHHEVTQVGLGLRREWGIRVLRPYLGAGVGWGEHRIDIENPEYGQSPRYSSQGWGWWATGGMLVRLGHHFNLGAGVRHSELNLEQNPSVYSDLSIWSILGSVGWAWPALEE